jgi:hypothetical protein
MIVNKGGSGFYHTGSVKKGSFKTNHCYGLGSKNNLANRVTISDSSDD